MRAQCTDTLWDAAPEVSHEDDPGNDGKPSVDDPWNTPGASIPPTPPSSVDALRERVVTIEADMRVMSNWRAMAAHEARTLASQLGRRGAMHLSSSCAG